MTKSILTKKILYWYDNNKRSLPWRKELSQVKREYYTLVSEFMLQQTQVATVIPYFNNFIKDIPDIKSLSKIKEHKLLKYWEGLGYYSRVKNLKKTAQILEKNFNRRLPNTIDELKLLPGIGDYTSNAIMAIAFNKPFIPLDGNIERVIKRLLNLKLPKEITKDNLEDEESKKKLSNINEKNENIKLLQEKYADSFSKNQSIKKESVKRNERIKAIESEVESWKNLLSNSEKMVSELTERKNKLLSQLNERDQQPKAQAERKGQITEGLRISQNEKIENEKIIEETDKKINSLRLELNNVQERSIQIRERKASSGATVEGLKKRKEDLLERVSSELNLEENDILENSNLNGVEELPDSVAQEDALDKKKNEREKLGSVNLRADEETSKYEIEIKKMEQDREDLVSAIIKLKESINELNQKGRERLLEAFEKVNRKFNEVYTKLFNGGNAKLELVDSDDPLEAGLEMLVSPPGKRLQSITLLSGGEQALTALSLIFAVFLTNPSPICVLDEVDAPLDDANVTRFCGLLDDLTKITDTKFIIVTHHALTMSKMNRLYGVTMPEKGISQLVAVDLQKAESMVA
ncbi:hypothetical protein OAS71_01290 [Candidatus Pelagibacter ubique]|nr:hypothetical protein [Candidatus Pelagibacter ubique]